MAEQYNLPKPSEGKAESNAIDIPGISIPKGGGAIKGIDEKFEVNPTNGSATLGIPVPVAGGRGFSPSLSLSYSTGAGNGPFGLGWSLSLGDISRKTDKGLPRYLDSMDSDVFLLAGCEDLVPAFKTDSNGNPAADPANPGYYIIDEHTSSNVIGIDGTVTIRKYIPRTEGNFSRIERITSSDGTIRWRVTSPSNSVSLLGWSENSRLEDPADKSRVFRWLPEFSYDNLGNCIQYIYKKDICGDATQIYPEKVLYCNRKAWYPKDAFPTEKDYLFSTVFNYGEYDLEASYEKPVSQWSLRQDIFSERRACFEVRTARLCRGVLLFSHMEEVPEGLSLLSSLELSYSESASMSLLVSARVTAFRKAEGGTYSSKAMPSMEYSYSKHSWNSEIKDADEVALGAGCTFCDLYREGIPGILYRDASSNLMLYRSNLGDGRFDVARPVTSVPNMRNLALMDLDSNGIMNLADMTPGEGGFYAIEDPASLEEGDDNAIAPFRPFESLPNITSDDNVRLIDLNGDGKSEMIVSSDSIYLWYPSEGSRGYSSYESHPMAIDEEDGPNVLFSNKEGSVFLADMTGDGLVDIVRVRCSEVYYYPNLGYGRFGKKIQMLDAPLLSSPQEFNPSMVLLADIDGTGTADLVYLADGSFKVFLNQCGRQYSKTPCEITSVPNIDSMTDVQMCDILGSGMAAIVWTSSVPQQHGRQIRFVDLLSSCKPYLLTGYSNSLGKEVHLEYTSSTEFYLEDKRNAEPWITRTGFPVYCLSKVETFDRISGWRFVTSYRYRDGHYDSEEREFRGFGMVQTKDTESFEHWALESSNLIDRTVHQEPVVTRSWVNLGIGRQSKDDAVFMSMGDDLLEGRQSMTDQELKEAYRALRGQNYRAEVYRPDQQDPCSVTISSARVKMLQPKGQNQHAVFIATGYQSFSRAFEDDKDDPRIKQSIILRTDCYGNALESVGISYPRKKKDSSAPAFVQKEQAKTLVTYTTASYTNDVITEDTYLLRTSASAFGYELTGFKPSKGEFFSPEDFSKDRLASAAKIARGEVIENTPKADVPAKRLLSGSQSLYFSEDLLSPLPVGHVAFPPVSYNSYILAFEKDTIDDIYGSKVSEQMMLEGKYVRLENDLVDEQARGGWWIPSGTAWLVNDNESAKKAKERFYKPIRFTDQFGTPTRVEYYSDTWMLISSIENVFSEKVSIEKFDFLCMQPTLIKDINGNYTEAVYDESGIPKASAVLGKGNEADSIDGISAITTDKEKDLIQSFLSETDPDRITSYAKELLGKASVRFVYDYDCYKKDRSPVKVASISRERHYKDDPDSPVQILFEYSNGSGAAILSKTQAEPDPDKKGARMRWIGSGRTILNNKGNAVMQFEPYFSDTPAFESDKEIVETGVTPVLHYVALGRNIQTDYPDGTFDMVEIHSWSVTSYSAGDTVKDSLWYARRINLDKDSQDYKAAVKSEVYYNTPATAYTSTSGTTICTVNAGQQTCAETDILGNLLSVTDPRGIKIQSYKYDLLGRAMFSEGPDNGRRWVFTDASDASVRAWDDRGHMTEFSYDIMRRPVSCRVITAELQDGEEKLDNIFARWTYGETLLKSVSLGALQQRNLLGQTVELWDTGGKVSTEAYDFMGSPLRVERRLTKAFKGTVNWTDDRLEKDLDSEVFPMRNEYDALSRVTKQIVPDGTIVLQHYNLGGLLSRQTVTLPESKQAKAYIEDITYNEKRQRCHIKYGNGITTQYTYNNETFRIEKIVSSRENGSLVQDLLYTFDAAGNLSHISDNSGKTYIHGNKKISGDSDYLYDNLGRLVSASGRENSAAIGRDSYDNFDDKDFVCEISDMDAMTIMAYTEEYQYDQSGNIISMHHISENNTWTRSCQYADDSNRLLSSSIGDYTYSYKYHPRHGFMTQMPHLSSLAWNFLEQMESSSRQVRTDGGTPETTYYQYDGSGQRIRKVIVNSSDSVAEGTTKDERIYIGGYEIYRKHSGTNKGLERVTISLIDGGTRFLMIERRNDIDDGTKKYLERYQMTNHIGSSTIELDESARIISFEEYTPYGTTSFIAKNKAIKAAAKRYKFTGMERDEETGLSYHSARYYIPWLGRWLSADPIGIEGGMNLYGYCGGNPIIRMDTNGTDFTLCEDGDGIFGTWSSCDPIEIEEWHRLEEMQYAADVSADQAAVELMEMPAKVATAGVDGASTLSSAALIVAKVHPAVRVLAFVSTLYNADQFIKDCRNLPHGANNESFLVQGLEAARVSEENSKRVELGLGFLNPEGLVKTAKSSYEVVKGGGEIVSGTAERAFQSARSSHHASSATTLANENIALDATEGALKTRQQDLIAESDAMARNAHKYNPDQVAGPMAANKKDQAAVQEQLDAISNKKTENAAAIKKHQDAAKAAQERANAVDTSVPAQNMKEGLKDIAISTYETLFGSGLTNKQKIEFVMTVPEKIKIATESIPFITTVRALVSIYGDPVTNTQNAQDTGVIYGIQNQQPVVY